MSKSSFCPFCVWSVVGLAALLGAPDLLGLATPLGPVALWLLPIPLASAVLRRGFVAASD